MGRIFRSSATTSKSFTMPCRPRYTTANVRLPDANSAVPETKCRASDPSGGPSRSRLITSLIRVWIVPPETSSNAIAPVSSTAPSIPLITMAIRNSLSVLTA